MLPQGDAFFFREKRYDAGLRELPQAVAAITPERAQNRRRCRYFTITAGKLCHVRRPRISHSTPTNLCYRKREHSELHVFFFLYSKGVTPTYFLNAVQKRECSEYPTSIAMAFTESSVSSKSFFAMRIFSLITA